MKAWYSKVRDTELIDGSVRADYVVTFETDNFELKRKVEKYLQGIMDEAEQTEPSTIPSREADWEEASKLINERLEKKWTKENCQGCKYNKYPYDESTCFVRVCINGNKYEPTTEDCSMVADCPRK